MHAAMTEKNVDVLIVTGLDETACKIYIEIYRYLRF
jgi:hypothetical protein